MSPTKHRGNFWLTSLWCQHKQLHESLPKRQKRYHRYVTIGAGFRQSLAISPILFNILIIEANSPLQLVPPPSTSSLNSKTQMDPDTRDTWKKYYYYAWQLYRGLGLRAPTRQLKSTNESLSPFLLASVGAQFKQYRFTCAVRHS